jgi:uncharacterized protein (TIGR03437 family)
MEQMLCFRIAVGQRGTESVHSGSVPIFRRFVIVLILAGTATAFGQSPSVGAVTNAADYSFTIAPGMIATIFGSGLAPSVGGASAIPLPTTLNGASVTVNGRVAPLFYVSPNQINFQVPYETQTGTATVQTSLSGQGASNTVQAPVASASAGIFQYGANRGVVQNQDYTLNTTTNPAGIGSILIVYLTGVGATIPSVADGAAAPGQPVAVAQAQSTATATIADINAPVSFLGLTPGSVGLAQANVQVPPSLPSGSYPLVITLNGHQSTSALVSVAGSGSGFAVASVLSLVGSLSLPNGVGITGLPGLQGLSVGVPQLLGNYLYVCGPPNISIVNVTNPAAPALVSQFGASDLNGQGFRCLLNPSAPAPFLVETVDVTNAPDNLVVYDLTNPTSPARRSLISSAYGPVALFNGTLAYVSATHLTAGQNYNITTINGLLNVVDFSNLANPVQGSGVTLSNPTQGMFAPSSNVTYQLTNTGDPNSGVGALAVYDTSTPNIIKGLSSVAIPGTVFPELMAASGNTLLVAGFTKGFLNPGYALPGGLFDFPEIGFLTLATFDITNARQPVLQGTTTTTLQPNFINGLVSLGGGLFALSGNAPDLLKTGPGVNNSLVIIDARAPATPQAYTYATIQGLGGLSVSGSYLYAATTAGVNVYQINQP